jgi:hypothetical protein
MGANGFDLQDQHGRQEMVWGTLLTFGVFAAIVIGRMLAG